MGALKISRFVLPLLSHSSGSIVASFANGTTLTRAIATDVTMVANGLYMIYLVSSGGSAQLRISSSPNSSGPGGFTTWTLVGAFYATGAASVAFGSFVKIYGKPTTDEILQGPLAHFGSISNPTKPSGSPDIAYLQRDGGFGVYRYAFSGAGAGSGGSGSWLFPSPANLTIDLSRIDGVGNSNSTQMGTCRWGNATIAYGGHCWLSSATRIGMASWQDGGALIISMGSSANVPTTSAYYGGFTVRVPITGWDETQLVDL